MFDYLIQYILSLVVFFPFIWMILLWLIPNSFMKDTQSLTKFMMLGFLFEFVFSLHLVKHFIPDSGDFQFGHISQGLLPQLGVTYSLGIDGISLILIILTTALFPIGYLMAPDSIRSRQKEFASLVLVMQTAVLGVFSSLDIVLFYFFWELSLVPVYFMIGVWGRDRKIYATLKTFIYGAFGSLLMLFAFIYIYVKHAEVFNGQFSTHLFDLYRLHAHLSPIELSLLFFAVTLAFAIKLPLFPFHTWLPDAYSESPTFYPFLSGVVVKLAAYAFIRFSLCMFPSAAQHYSQLLIGLGIVGLLYGALVAWRQTSIRRMMAYSSVSHLGLILAGVFACNHEALTGALYQMVNHAVTAGAFWILIQVLENRSCSDRLDHFGGLAARMPWFAFFFVVASLSSVALPSTGSFIGEWLLMLGIFRANPLYGFLAALGVIFGAIYILWLCYRVVWGPTHKNSTTWSDIGAKECFQLSFLTIAIFAMGFASSYLLEHTQTTVQKIYTTVNQQQSYKARFEIRRDMPMEIPAQRLRNE